MVADGYKKIEEDRVKMESEFNIGNKLRIEALTSELRQRTVELIESERQRSQSLVDELLRTKLEEARQLLQQSITDAIKAQTITSEAQVARVIAEEREKSQRYEPFYPTHYVLLLSSSFSPF
jgi:hypothetical protein